jgi:hypothetical protein
MRQLQDDLGQLKPPPPWWPPGVNAPTLAAMVMEMFIASGEEGLGRGVLVG